MIAIEIEKPGAPSVLRPVDRPVPEPQRGEVQIQVKAAGVSRADLMQREGRYAPPAGASDIPGLDVAGIVDALGEDTTGFQPGDKVCAILSGGGYAEYCTAPVHQVLPMPQNWTFAEAATLPENLFTVFDNLVTRAGLRAGETVLIHGGTSGIGSMALMVSRALGAKALATAGSDSKCQACLQLGAEHAINYRTEDFVEVVRQQTGGRGVDVILDMVGAAYLQRNLEALAMEGRLTIVATRERARSELDLMMLMQKRLRVMASTMRARSAEQKGLVAERLRSEIWPLLPSKDPIRPVLDRTFPMAEAARAHEWLEGGQHIGKIVLLP